jgi:demethylmenaquinone methyltransferase/2-methoxy-6-polyprenyl-1,4-benzoquinol methylase
LVSSALRYCPCLADHRESKPLSRIVIFSSFTDVSPKENSKMSNNKNGNSVVDTYQKRATRYDFTLKLIDFFALFGFNISGWRKQAISSLNLKPGDTVVDLGCGTGSNFSLLHQAVTSSGKIIAVDISDAMLNQARQIITFNHWTNIQLVCSDVAQFEFPSNVNAVVSAYTLILVPNCKQVISNAHESLSPGGRLVILDMAWPSYFPLWFRHILFFLRSYGVTLDVLRRRSWEVVQLSMKELFHDYSQKQFWFGFFYLAGCTA